MRTAGECRRASLCPSGAVARRMPRRVAYGEPSAAVIENLSLPGVVARVAKLLFDCTQGRPALVEGSGGTCHHRLTQHEIAAMNGSVREVVQRALKTLERDGAIRMERARVVVLDAKALERWSESYSNCSRYVYDAIK